MADGTKIEWCDATFNPWVGCTKVSPACDHCYAESWAKRTGQAELWQGERRLTRPSYWAQPFKWDRAAKAAGIRKRVFCASLADWLDNQVEYAWRLSLAELIEATPNLDWLLLTKRPQNFDKCSPWLRGEVPPNVWLGVTAENQEEADRRIPLLLDIPAAKRFISAEPLLQQLYLTEWLHDSDCDIIEHGIMGTCTCSEPREEHIDWVIAGGESGPNARPMHPQWARSLRDQCAAAGVAYFHKQNGEWAAERDWYENHRVSLPCRVWDGKQWSDDGGIDGEWLVRVGKAKAGRLLDGRTWDEFPA